ncbi:TPA: excalibur calcium-binding domain-containing protein [Mannheimia haemolytica]
MARRRKIKGSGNIGGFMLILFVASGLSKCIGGDSKEPLKGSSTQTQSLVQSIDTPSKLTQNSSLINDQEKEKDVLISTKELPLNSNNQKQNYSKKINHPESAKTLSTSQTKVKPKTNTKQPNSRNTQKPATSLQCGGKRYCSEMNNCAEAKFYLRQCGIKSLDRDRDGIPCESICG